MKDNTILFLSFVSVAAAYALAGIQGAAGASVIAGLVLIFMADYASRPQARSLDVKALRAPCVPERPDFRPGRSGDRKTADSVCCGWPEPGSLQRRLVDGPVY